MNSSLPPLDGLEVLSARLLEQLRERFQGAAFDETVFGEAECLPGQAERARLPIMRWLLERRQAPWAGFARLFVYHMPVTPEEMRDLMGEELASALAGAGLFMPCANAPDQLRSRLRIMPFRGLWCLGDLADGGGDAVMTPGITTLQLAWLMPLDMAGSVLDLGCGSGALALLAAARGAPRAVGCDLNARAVRMARFNARLNGLDAEFLAGDMYAPVLGRRFDLVVSQPPYVILPAGTQPVAYLHGGPRGEDLVLRALQGLGQALAPGAMAAILADTPLPVQEHLTARYRRALGEARLDLAIALSPAPPLEPTAFTYSQVVDESLGERYQAEVARYLEHLSGLDTPGFRHAAILVRAPALGVSRPALSMSFPVAGFGQSVGRSVEAFFASVDLSAVPADRLLATTVRLNPLGRWSLDMDGPVLPPDAPRKLRFQGGALAVDQSLPEATCFLLHCLADSADVASGLATYAQACSASLDQIEHQALDFLRHALRSGILEPQPAPDGG